MAKVYNRHMLEKFKAGDAKKGVESLMVGKVFRGNDFEDVRPQLEVMDEIQRKSLILLVTCDRIWGFFEQREGQANGPRLVKLVRDLAGELGLKNVKVSRDVTKWEARAYYDELVKMGAIEFVGELGAKNVFCTIWECINKMVGEEESTLEEALRRP